MTVAPTEPLKTVGAAGDPARKIAGAAAGTSISAATSNASPVSPASVPAVASSLAVPPPEGSDAAAIAAREEQLRREQIDLQKQVKALSDQINALRVQATTLSTRNQSLEAAAFSPILVWLLIALAAIAIAIAGWMALRYVQLRRSVEGSAWWSANTVQAAASVVAATKGAVDPYANAIDPNTRANNPQIDTRLPAAVAGSASTSNVQDRLRTPPRTPRYAAAIDTDFTVSDIEAAMATVRTVSPPRAAPRPGPLEETDFAALGGPTLPSPFTDPPPAASASSEVANERAQSAQTKDRGRTADAPDTFVDLDIPPLAPFKAPASRAPQSIVESEEGITPLDLKLDIPEHYDPLATNSMKTTIVDRFEPTTGVDFELPSAPMPLDFELPSTSEVMGSSMSAGSSDHTLDRDDTTHTPVRRAASALDDIFPPLGSPGVDTILNLDEQDGAPLITTEVDHLTSTEVEGTQSEAQQATTRFRLARFADLMHQVDETAHTDPLRAITMLRQHVLRDEHIPTLMWLRLFDLYKRVDKKPVYEALGEHFARRYNRAMIGWSERLDDRVPQKPLTAMVEIDKNLESRWGSEDGLERLRSLLCDRNQPDTIVFNAVLQQDLLDAAKVFPLDNNTLTDFGSAGTGPVTSLR